MKLPALAVACLVCCAAFPVLADPSADARKAIDANNRKWSAALAKGDAKGIAALYAEDAVILPPHSAQVKGRAGIETTFAEFIKGGVKSLDLTTTELEVRSDLAFETGTWTLTLQPEGKEPVKDADSGKYLVVWKKSGSGWQYFRDIWNTSLPPAPAPSAKAP